MNVNGIAKKVRVAREDRRSFTLQVSHWTDSLALALLPRNFGCLLDLIRYVLSDLLVPIFF